MPTHKQLHLFEAKAADTRISRDQPTVARVNFSLTNGESLEPIPKLLGGVDRL